MGAREELSVRRAGAGRLGRALRGAALAAPLVARAARSEEPPRVEAIEIRRLNVFTEEEADRSFFPYGLANAVHSVTRDAFVRKELLFGLGDPIDPERLAETERKLRARGIFRTVRVASDVLAPTRVVVETADAWTLIPRVTLSRKGGKTEWAVGMQDANVLGSGRELAVRYERESDRVSRSFFYSDPQAFWENTLLDVSAADLSDGREFGFSLRRPFYALATPRAAGVAHRQALFDTTLYAKGDAVAKWRKRERSFRVDGGVKLFGSESTATRLLLAVDWQNVSLARGDFGPPPPPGPRRRFLFVTAGVEREGFRWIERRDVNTLDRDEDFNLAPRGRIEVGVSPSLHGAWATEAAARVKAAASSGSLCPAGFALFSFTGETRHQDGFRNARGALDARAYLLSGGGAAHRPTRVTVAARLGVVAGYRLDPEDRAELDGLNGVRGYRQHAVSGTGHAVGNVEARVALASDVLNLVSLGVAVFADAGVSWGDPDGYQRLADAGVGLRIGLTRASKNTLIRVDVARAFLPDPAGRTGWLFSFGSGQAF